MRYEVKINEMESYITHDYADARHAAGHEKAPFVSSIADSIREQISNYEDEPLEIMEIEKEEKDEMITHICDNCNHRETLVNVSLEDAFQQWRKAGGIFVNGHAYCCANCRKEFEEKKGNQTLGPTC